MLEQHGVDSSVDEDANVNADVDSEVEVVEVDSRVLAFPFERLRETHWTNRVISRKSRLHVVCVSRGVVSIKPELIMVVTLPSASSKSDGALRVPLVPLLPLGSDIETHPPLLPPMLVWRGVVERGRICVAIVIAMTKPSSLRHSTTTNDSRQSHRPF